jgi:hypothetical protein
MIYILSCVIHKFFFRHLTVTVDKHLDLALFRSDHHRLLSHAPYHVKGIHRSAPKRQLQGVFLNALLQRLFQIVGNLEEPVGRAQTSYTLVRSLVIVQLTDSIPIRPNAR